MSKYHLATVTFWTAMFIIFCSLQQWTASQLHFHTSHCPISNMFHSTPILLHIIKVKLLITNYIRNIIVMFIIIILGCVVPSFLHRAFARCTLAGDTKHHVQFLRKILENRSQNLQVTNRKFDAFFSKKSQKK